MVRAFFTAIFPFKSTNLDAHDTIKLPGFFEETFSPNDVASLRIICPCSHATWRQLAYMLSEEACQPIIWSFVFDDRLSTYGLCRYSKHSWPISCSKFCLSLSFILNTRSDTSHIYRAPRFLHLASAITINIAHARPFRGLKL